MTSTQAKDGSLIRPSSKIRLSASQVSQDLATSIFGLSSHAARGVSYCRSAAKWLVDDDPSLPTSASGRFPSGPLGVTSGAWMGKSHGRPLEGR